MDCRYRDMMLFANMLSAGDYFGGLDEEDRERLVDSIQPARELIDSSDCVRVHDSDCVQCVRAAEDEFFYTVDKLRSEYREVTRRGLTTG